MEGQYFDVIAGNCLGQRLGYPSYQPDDFDHTGASWKELPLLGPPVVPFLTLFWGGFPY